jgi:hypothetical protein
MLLDPEDSLTSINVNRKKRVSKILELWQNISADSIKVDWNPQDPKNILRLPPAIFKEDFNLGQSPDTIKDPIVKREYTEYLEKRAARLNKASEQKWAKEIVHEDKDIVKNYIIDSYSLRPFATAELEQLLKTYKFDSALSKEILEAVRKAEQEAPPPISEFRNWETTDGLFKTKAKFISSDGKTVTIEKENGKKVTLNVEDLRWSDKNVIKEKTKKTTDKKSD